MADQPDPSIIYTGSWYNHNVGGIRGHRLTLPDNQARVLMAGLVVLVTIAANRSWWIWSFFIHKFLTFVSRSGRGYKALREEQVVLRNTETAGGAVSAIMMFTIHQRKQATKFQTITRMALSSFAVLHFATFIAFSLLTPLIEDGRTVRSIRTSACGEWMPTNYDKPPVNDFGKYSVMRSLSINTTIDASNYARTCYQGQKTNPDSESQRPFGCEYLVEASLPFTTEEDECPFSREACKGEGNLAFAMESGNISFKQLGFNFNGASQLRIRRRTVCAPIKSTPFLYNGIQKRQYLRESPADFPEELIVYAHLLVQSDPPLNYTQQLRNTSITLPSYELTSLSARNASETFPLLTPLDPRMSLSVVTLHSSGIMFNQPSTDPLFFATRKFESAAGATFYRIGNPVNSIACQEAAMYCSEITGRCSEWRGLTGQPIPPDGSSFPESYRLPLWQVLFGENYLEDKYLDAKRVTGIISAIMMETTIESAIGGRGSQALQASLAVADGVQLQISNEQWKVELETWFTVMLARLQRAVIRLVKTPDLDYSKVENIWVRLNATASMYGVCNMVLFNSATHTTLSTAGLMFTLTFTLLVMLLSYVMPALSLKWGRVGRIMHSWDMDAAVELLRRAEAVTEVQLESPSSQGVLDQKRTGGSTVYIPVFQSG